MYKYSELYSIKKEKRRMWHRIIIFNLLLAVIIATSFMTGWYCSKVYHWKVYIESEESQDAEESAVFMREIQAYNGLNP